jgi:opacity protein-like surface antigen
MRRIGIIILLLICCVALQAQKFYRKSEFGISAGGAHYFGDLNQRFQLNFPREHVGVFIKYNFTPYIALKVAANYARVGFQDSYVNNPYQQKRNLSFENRLGDLVIQSEFNFFRYRIADFDYRFTPYISLGAGFLFHDPYAYYNKEKIFLKPLGTEGQNLAEYKKRVYKKNAFTFPVGLGTKFWVTKGVTLGFELSYRYTSTDYLDDVSTYYVGADKFFNPSSVIQDPSYYLQDRSIELGNTIIGNKGKQRGISSTKDHYILAQISLSIRMLTYQCPANY